MPIRLVARFSSSLATLVALGALSAITPLTTAHAQDESDKWSIHGYLTQGYAQSDRLPIHGLDRNGEWDYRALAVQLNYAISDEGRFVVQVRNREFGSSVLNDQGVQVDWAYYAHDFGPVAIKVGKAPLPLGLYNDIRAVGTLLPFFRAADGVYFDGVETLEGVVVSGRRTLGDWSVDASAYGGGVEFLVPIQTPSGPTLFSTKMNNNVGGQLWLNTPISGLRVGAAVFRFHLPVPTATGVDTTTNTRYHLSLDGTFDRFFVRSEYMSFLAKKAASSGAGDTKLASGYGEAGVKLIGGLSVNGQYVRSNQMDGTVHYRNIDDRVLGINYAFSPELVAKLEGHDLKGYNFDQYIPPTGPPGKTHYAIASLSVSF